MKKLPSQKNALLDKLHKGFVCTCLAVTIYGFSVLGLRYYRYLTETKPKLDEQKMIENKSLLAEGSSDTLIDKAETVRL